MRGRVAKDHKSDLFCTNTKCYGIRLNHAKQDQLLDFAMLSAGIGRAPRFAVKNKFFLFVFLRTCQLPVSFLGSVSSIRFHGLKFLGTMLAISTCIFCVDALFWVVISAEYPLHIIVCYPPLQWTLDLFTHLVQSEPLNSMLNVKDAQIQTHSTLSMIVITVNVSWRASSAF